MENMKYHEEKYPEAFETYWVYVTGEEDEHIAEFSDCSICSRQLEKSREFDGLLSIRIDLLLNPTIALEVCHHMYCLKCINNLRIDDKEEEIETTCAICQRCIE